MHHIIRLVALIFLAIVAAGNASEATTIQMKRGTAATLPATLKMGEPGFARDTHQVFVGYSTGKVELLSTTDGKVVNEENILSYIPSAYHAGIKARTDTHDLSSYFVAAIASNRTVKIPDGRYFLGSTVVVSGRIDRFSFVGDGAAEITRTTDAPMFVFGTHTGTGAFNYSTEVQYRNGLHNLQFTSTAGTNTAPAVEVRGVQHGSFTDLDTGTLVRGIDVYPVTAWCIFDKIRSTPGSVQAVIKIIGLADSFSDNSTGNQYSHISGPVITKACVWVTGQNFGDILISNVQCTGPATAGNNAEAAVLLESTGTVYRDNISISSIDMDGYANAVVKATGGVKDLILGGMIAGGNVTNLGDINGVLYSRPHADGSTTPTIFDMAGVGGVKIITCGGVDDTSVIQAALNDTAYKTVELGDATCKTTSTLTISRPMVFRGRGQEASVISRSTDFGDTLLIAPSDPVNSMIYNIRVDGIKFSQSTSKMTNGAHVHVKSSGNVTVNDVATNGGWGGVLAEKVNKLDLKHWRNQSGNLYTTSDATYGFMAQQGVYTADPRNYMITLDDWFINTDANNKYIKNGIAIYDNDTLKITTGHVQGYYGNGILLAPPTGSYLVQATLENNYIDSGAPDATSIGINVADTGGTLGDITISNSPMNGEANVNAYGGKNGILVNSPHVNGLKIQGNTIFDWEEEGINVVAGRNVSIHGNNVSSNNHSAIGKSGIKIAPNLIEIMASINQIGVRTIYDMGNTQTIGLEVGSGCTNCSFGPNTYGTRNTTNYSIGSGTNREDGASVSDTVYASTWNGVTDVAPSKNAVYDKIESHVGDASNTIHLPAQSASTASKWLSSNGTTASWQYLSGILALTGGSMTGQMNRAIPWGGFSSTSEAEVNYYANGDSNWKTLATVSLLDLTYRFATIDLDVWASNTTAWTPFNATSMQHHKYQIHLYRSGGTANVPNEYTIHGTSANYVRLVPVTPSTPGVTGVYEIQIYPNASWGQMLVKARAGYNLSTIAWATGPVTGSAGTPITPIVDYADYVGQLISSAPIGTPPLTVTSTTKVLKLNVEQVDDADLDTDATLAANSDLKFPSQKAIKAYIAAQGFAPLLSPTFTTPSLGVATATSINKLVITQPATSSTLTVADGKTLTASNSITLSGPDGSALNIGSGGTLGSGAFKPTTTTSAGATDAGKIPLLDGSGKLDSSVIPPTTVTSGTYTPTMYASNNLLSAPTASSAIWFRIGNVVTVTGSFSATAVAYNAYTEFAISLPVTSTFTSTADAGGTGAILYGPALGITANPTDPKVIVKFMYSPYSGYSMNGTYTFTYVVK